MKRSRKGSAQQFPNRDLAIAISRECGVKGCEEHGTISKSEGGKIVVRCLGHLNHKSKAEKDAELLAKVGL